MAYGQWPGQDGQQEWPDDDGRPRPSWGSAQRGDTQRFGPYGQPGYDERGQQAGGDGRWQPPDWRYGQQRHEQGNGQRGFAPGQYQPHFQPAPPSPPGQRGFGPPSPPPPYRPPQPADGPPRPPRGKSWPARHKVLTGVFGFAALIIIIAVANSGGSHSSPGSGTAVGLTTSASATPTRAPSQHATRAAAVVQKTPPPPVRTTSAPTRAAVPPAPAPATHAAVVAAPASTPPAPAAPASCHPLTNGGNCYEPGEYCRDSDHDVSGVAGDGKAITCEDNDGWRWEPA
jgi:hypothetical protein